MDVQATQARNVEHRLRQDQAIGGHDHHISAQLTQPIPGLRIAQRRWLPDLDAMSLCPQFDRAGDDLLATLGRLVGAGEHQGDVVSGPVQGIERTLGKDGCPGKNQPHVHRPDDPASVIAGAQAASRSSLSILLRMRPCLSRERY